MDWYTNKIHLKIKTKDRDINKYTSINQKTSNGLDKKRNLYDTNHGLLYNNYLADVAASRRTNLEIVREPRAIHHTRRFHRYGRNRCRALIYRNVTSRGEIPLKICTSDRPSHVHLYSTVILSFYLALSRFYCTPSFYRHYEANKDKSVVYILVIAFRNKPM